MKPFILIQPVLFLSTTQVLAAKSQPAPTTKPSEIVLFDGSGTGHWQSKDGAPATWKIENGELVATKPDAETKEKFKDFTLHLEFWLPKSRKPASTNRSDRTNSGVYLQGRYEIQLLDSYGLAPLTYQDCGGIYENKAPDVNACLPTERWQTMDITFRAARYDGAGNKLEKARVTILQNDTPIHKDVEIDHYSKSGSPEGAEDGPIRLQFHGYAVRFRNIRITPQ